MFETYEVRHATFTEDSKELTALMNTDDLAVLRAVGENPKAYKKNLKVLAQHHDPQVRASVASNEAAAPAVLTELAKDTDSDVRFYVALNAGTPSAALNILLNDPDKEVARMAGISMEALEDTGHQRKHGSRARFVSNALAAALKVASLADDAEAVTDGGGDD